jgi:hypothetical protein
MTALLSFLGGSVFRMLWGEISAMLTKSQDHKHEIERMRLGDELSAREHARQQDAIRLQAELGIKVIEAKSEAAISEIEAEGWLEAVRGTTKTVGIWFVDAWNAVIRPGTATWSLVMMTVGEFGLVVLSENTISVCSAALGIYLADRNLMKRGK